MEAAWVVGPLKRKRVDATRDVQSASWTRRGARPAAVDQSAAFQRDRGFNGFRPACNTTCMVYNT